MRAVSGSADGYGSTRSAARIVQPSSSWLRSTVAIIPPGLTCLWPVSFQRPMWWEQAMTPGRMPWVIQALATK